MIIEENDMEAVMAMQGAAVKTPQPSRQQMPLTFLRNGEKAEVLKVRGNAEMRHHLENLGFVPGATLSVVNQQGGNYIVEIKGAQVAIDRSVASKIIAA